MVRTRARNQYPAGPEQPQGAQVDVFVAAHRAVDLFTRLGERRRVENDSVKVTARGRITRQDIENVGLAKRHVRDAVGGGVPIGGGESGGARIDSLDLLAGSRKMQREASRRGKAIESAPGGVACGRQIVFALIEKDAGLLPRQQVRFHLKSVHVNGHGSVEFSRQELDFAGQFLQRADRRVVSANDCNGRKLRVQCRQNLRSGVFHSLIERLDGEGIPVTVDDESRKKIGLGVNEPISGGIGDHLLAEPLCSRNSRSYIERAGGFGEHAQGNLRCGAVVGLSQELAAGVEDADDRACGRLAHISDIGAENPGVPGAKAISAFSGNVNFGWFQSNMVADSFPSDSVIYSGHMVNRLAGMRKARGVSAVELAGQVGVTRQAIYAIEAGTYMPNTAVALRLARVLGTSVEDLFTLEEETSPAAELQSFEPLDDAFSFEAGEPIQICRVGRRAIGIAPPVFPAWLPLADGIVSDSRHAAMAGDPDDANRLLIAGCDPAHSLLARHAREAGIEVILASGNSARSLEWLRDGKIDVAGSHLNDPIEGGRAFSVVTFAVWEEGFVVRRGNPKAIRSVADLANPRVRFVNREEGSGSRKLFDSLIEVAGMTSAKVKGSDTSVPGHLAAAWAVASGAADCCIAAGSAARRFGLDFVPIATERFELVLHKRDLTRKPVQGVLEVLNRARFRRQLETIAGYDVARAGETIA